MMNIMNYSQCGVNPIQELKFGQILDPSTYGTIARRRCRISARDRSSLFTKITTGDPTGDSVVAFVQKHSGKK